MDQIAGMLDAMPWMKTALGIAALLLVAVVADFIARRVLVRTISRLTRRTEFTWDDELARYRVFARIAQIAPAAVVWFGVPLVPQLPDTVVRVVQNVAFGFAVFMLVLAAGALLSAANAIYEKYPIARDRPIKGFVQVAKIVLYVVGTILVLAALMERSPLLFLSGFGALTAVLMLVFKDTILSLVASVQITSTDIIRVGDWVEMPQYGADGDIVDIALHTVKVQNWDKTVTTIPTHKFISDSFRNWRFMSLSGGRRIKRAINIDLGSVRFLDDAETDRFADFRLLADYVAAKRSELEQANRDLGDGRNANVNARRLTNIGTFRAYVLEYLRVHRHIHEDMTLLVRQLEPGPKGLPLQVYAFTNDTAWANYENIQADIFDHLLAILPEFGLRVFQEPTGRDLAALAGRPDCDRGGGLAISAAQKGQPDEGGRE